MHRLWTAFLDWTRHHSHQAHALVALALAAPGPAVVGLGAGFWALVTFAVLGPAFYAGHEIDKARRLVSVDYTRNWIRAIPRAAVKADFLWPAAASAGWIGGWAVVLAF